MGHTKWTTSASTIIATALTFANVAVAIIHSPVHDPELMLMAWPPPALTIPTWRDRQPLSAEAANPDLHPAIFDCSYHKPPPNVKRTPFPITGGRLQLNRTGTAWINTYPRIPHDIAGDWMMNIRYGQFQNLPGIPEDAYHVMDSSHMWYMDEFKPGLFCDEPLKHDFVDVQTGVRENVYPVDASQLEGLELTLAVELFHFYPKGSSDDYDSSAGTITVQCAYIRLTSEQVDSPCSPGSDSDSGSGSDSPQPSPTDTGTPSPSGSTAPGAGNDVDSDHKSNSPGKKVIIAVAVTSGIAVPVIVIAALLALRRRKRRGTTTITTEREFAEKKPGISKEPRPKPTKPSTVTTTEKKQQAGNSKKDAGDGDQASIHTDHGSSSSVLTEPLPRYEPKSSGNF